ncbi:MAG TPA: ATP synthase F0 subunit A [Anaerolineae bacterium]|nr:ATP synthase F0 subunit A [Anaerolineae bacterium]
MSKLLKPRNLALILGIVALLLIAILFVRVPLPTILLPAEHVPGLKIGNFPITNTFIATILADIVVLVLGFLAVRRMQEVPESRLQNIFEWIIEVFDGMLTDIGGKEKARSWLAVFMTILLFLLFANWLELVPGVDSIGYIEPVEVAYAKSGVTVGYEKKQIGPFLTLTNKQVKLTDEEMARIKEEYKEAKEKGEEYHPHEAKGYVLVPYVRAAATDLNLTIGLALLVVLWSHIIGFRRLGGKYIRRFALPHITGMKPIDLLVGVLEFISEFAKVISLSFRLFGNIFAGQVLLFVMAFLVAFLLPVPFMGLELFVGFMQAFVFAILTFIYFEQATHSHAGDEHH